MKAEFEPTIRQELIETARWYLTKAGAAQASAFEGEITRILVLPLRLPELGAGGRRNTRSIPLRHYPYSLHYRVEPGVIRIIAVAHHRRRPGYWAKRG